MISFAVRGLQALQHLVELEHAYGKVLDTYTQGLVQRTAKLQSMHFSNTGERASAENASLMETGQDLGKYASQALQLSQDLANTWREVEVNITALLSTVPAITQEEYQAIQLLSTELSKCSALLHDRANGIVTLNQSTARGLNKLPELDWGITQAQHANNQLENTYRSIAAGVESALKQCAELIDMMEGN